MRRWLAIATALVLASPAIAADELTKDVAECLVQARVASGPTSRDANGHTTMNKSTPMPRKGKFISTILL